MKQNGAKRARTYLQVARIGRDSGRRVGCLVEVAVLTFVLVDLAVRPRESWMARAGIVVDGVEADPPDSARL